jgi:hypothetical protein
MTGRSFRALALALPHATEGAHMGHPDFRVGGKIFATLGHPRRGWAMVKLSREHQELFIRSQTAAFAPVKGAWGLAGATAVRLASARKGAVQEALLLAWRHRAPKHLVARTVPEAPGDAERQVQGFIAKFEPRHQALIRAVRKALRQRFRTAYELAYDNYNFFVLGYGPTERPSDCVVSIAAGANGVGLCFIHGAHLPDPDRLLLGSGTQTRFIRIESASVLLRPAVKALMAAAVVRAKTPFPARGSGTLIVRSVSAKQRPRRRSAR